MISASDCIALAYSSELPAAGCLYACRELVYASDFTRSSRYPALRQSARQAVVELALQHYLEQIRVPFSRKSLAPFTAPGHTSLVLGGRFCHTLLTATGSIDELTDLEKLNLLPAPEDSLPDAHEDEELLIFVVMSVPGSILGDTMEEAWVYPLQEDWARPLNWVPLGTIELLTGSEDPVEVTLDGVDSQHRMIRETVHLIPGTPVNAGREFYSLTILQVEVRPKRKIILRTGREKLTSVYPYQWTTLWTPGIRIWLLGYLSRGESRRWLRTHPENKTYPMHILHPLQPLFEQIKR